MTNCVFSRYALAHLEAWRLSDDRKALVLRGARQVGKTSLVRTFSRQYQRYAELNLERKAHADLFRRDMSIHDLVKAIELECAVPPGKDPLLLFIDEIQEVPGAVKMMRFFIEDYPEIHLVAAGSLLELALETSSFSFPVGRVQYLYIRPMSFLEFLEAAGTPEALAAAKEIPAPAHAHDFLLRQFHTYALVGGMPEAVKKYLASGGSLAAVNQVYADLFTAFRDDIFKYARNETMRRILLHCLDTAPYEAGSRIAFQGFGGSNYRSREAGEALRTLAGAMLLELVYPSTQVREPVMPDHKKSPRLQFLDTGLVNHRAGIQRDLIGVKDLTDIHRGRLIEQIIGQELKTLNPRMDIPLRFWVRDKFNAQAEVDFLVCSSLGVIPVEAKSGAAGKLRSLHQFMVQGGYPLAVRLYAGPWSRQSVTSSGIHYTLLNIPYYAASLLTDYVEKLAE
jgi:predicted AAA+ superfamily ATPase